MRNPKCRYLYCLVYLVIPLLIYAQLEISSPGTPYSIDFEQTVSGVNNDTFMGLGLTPNPEPGQLDSDGWRVNGNNNRGTFGGTFTSGIFAMGTSDGGVTNGRTNAGVYGFDVNNGASTNRAFGIQHISNPGGGGSVLTPGYFTLRIHNTSGKAINELEIRYNIYVFNDKVGASSFYFSHSRHGNQSGVWIQEPSVNFISPGQPTGAQWSPPYSRSITIRNLVIPNDSIYYLRWTIDDASGTNTKHDEIALDDIIVNASAVPAELLPVGWLTFSVNEENGNSFLKWQTAQELNNAFFEVEHSINGEDWDPIGRVEGSGTSTSTETYHYIHDQPSSGMNYYRLRQVDIDGESELSRVRKVMIEPADRLHISVYPNPAEDFLNISANKSSVEFKKIHLLSSSGVTILSWRGNISRLSLAGLPSGVYYLQIDTGDSIFTKLVLKS